MVNLNIPSSNIKKPKRFRLTLFWKILLWFWLTIVFLITLFLFIGYVNSDKIHYRPLPPPIDAELDHMVNRISRAIQFQREPAHQLQHKLTDIYLLNEQGIDFFQRPVPELLDELHSRVKRHQRPLTAFRKAEAYFGGRTLQMDKQTLWLYRQQKSRQFSGHLFQNFFHDVARVLLAATFIISFPVSFILSWLITRPIKQLRHATLDLKANLHNREHLNQLICRSDEFAELADDFNQMASHLSTLMMSQKQLVSDVSHELRSPLSRLKIAAGILQQQLAEKHHESLARINLESDRMNEMLDSLLTLSKLEAQQIKAEKAPCDLTQLFTMVVEDGRFEATQSGITIETDFPATCPLQGNSDMLISGIENILRNAIRYSDENSVIQCRLTRDNGLIVLQIKDNGPGVEEDQLSKLFDPFYRPNTHRNRQSGGVGLGLAIARQAFTQNGGLIAAKNSQPHGLEVTVTFSS